MYLVFIMYYLKLPPVDKKALIFSLTEFVAIVTVLTLILDKLLQKEIPVKVRIKDPQFKLLVPIDTAEKYTFNDKYDNLLNLKNFKFLSNPQPCNGYDAGLLFVVVIHSNPGQFDKRMAIRNTWGRSFDSNKLVFLLGEPNDSLVQKVNEEIATYQDIVQGNFKDAYRNLTYKHLMGLKWVSHHCSTAKYILKLDDDVLVNRLSLKHFLVRQLSPWGAKDLIGCSVKYNSPVERNKGLKWYVTEEEYPGTYYPSYCAGTLIIYSQDVVRRLLEGTQKARFFWIDDALITGDVAKTLGLGDCHAHIGPLILSNHKADLLAARGPKYHEEFLFGPFDLSAGRIVQLWNAMTTSNGVFSRCIGNLRWRQ